MIRRIYFAATLCSLALALGCTGSAEVKPDESLTPQVDQAEIERNIREGMQQGGMDSRYQGQAPGSGEK